MFLKICSQGKKHQSNLGRRAAKEAKDAPQQPAPEKARVDIKQFVKIGRPGYRVTKQRCPESGQQSLMFEVDYPEIAEGIQPRHRFMSAYEQKMEPPDRKWQYLLFAAEPYETISFKVCTCVPPRCVDTCLIFPFNKLGHLLFFFKSQAKSIGFNFQYGTIECTYVPVPVPVPGLYRTLLCRS